MWIILNNSVVSQPYDTVHSSDSSFLLVFTVTHLGAKAMMLPYALRHASQHEDRVAEQWELQLAEFLAVCNTVV